MFQLGPVLGVCVVALLLVQVLFMNTCPNGFKQNTVTPNHNWPDVFSSSTIRALREVAATHPSEYFRNLATEILAAPNATAAARLPYECGEGISLHPISFSIPASFFQQQLPAKAQNCSSVIPGVLGTYRFKATKANSAAEILASERDYHADMSRSLFAVTYKKGGWDCMRHLEIIAAGALPVFTDVTDLPVGTLAAYPLKVLELLTKWPGLTILGLPGTPPGPGGRPGAQSIVDSTNKLVSNGDVVCNLTEQADRHMYTIVALAMLQYGQAMLSTAGMARYLAQTVGIQPHDRILFFGSGDSDDYQADTLLHGLQSVMSTPVVDWPKSTGMYADTTTFTEGEMASARISRYGGGFSYSYRIHEPFGLNRTGVEGQLQHPMKHYDYFIFGITHRTEWHKYCGKMPRDRVVMVFGSDQAPSLADLRRMHACGSHTFTREMPSECKLKTAIAGRP